MRVLPLLVVLLVLVPGCQGNRLKNKKKTQTDTTTSKDDNSVEQTHYIGDIIANAPVMPNYTKLPMDHTPHDYIVERMRLQTVPIMIVAQVQKDLGRKVPMRLERDNIVVVADNAAQRTVSDTLNEMRSKEAARQRAISVQWHPVQDIINATPNIAVKTERGEQMAPKGKLLIAGIQEQLNYTDARWPPELKIMGGTLEVRAEPLMQKRVGLVLQEMRQEMRKRSTAQRPAQPPRR